MDTVAPCEGCGCLGNTECGLDCLDTDNFCGLDGGGLCGCCAKIGVEQNKKRQFDFIHRNQLSLL